MSKNQPNLINDSVLTNAVYELLKRVEHPLSAFEIAKEVISIENLPSDLADKMIYIILKNDSRFRQNRKNKWMLSDRFLETKKIANLDYIVLDVEIVGHARSPHMIEIAAFHLRDLKIVNEFCTYINPGRAIIPKVLPNLTGEVGRIINTETLQKAPTFEQIIPDFFKFIGNKILVAHNAHFDLRMINLELRRLGHQKLVNHTIDTLKISRKMIRGVDTQKLPNLAYYFGVPMEEHHLAREDAKVLAKIFINLIGLLEEKNIEQFNQISPFLISL